jgi:hypothetical protein
MRVTIATTRRSTSWQAPVLFLLAAACGRADRAAAPAAPPAADAAAATVATATIALAPTAPPPPTATPTATPQTLSVVVPLLPEPEPTPTWAPRPTATPRVPTPTPLPSQCLDLEWWIGEGAAPLGSTLVEVEVSNRCGRDLDGMQVWFEVTGYLGGGIYQSVRGHLFEELRAGRQGSTGVVLPCSTDWCDEIAVRVVDPLPP